ncbi:hypothetical protein HHK36_027736 [Tetracentron sinense]|uniref:Serine/threonine-protein kinase BSK1-like TPR repeats domain-containing protein n=1 Tax=Tetracentron sinense TaxID=13715 RepID=A0A834YI13_TETSI|nr:hypothetical protein HHK36_027736 [Tetracentron sinense]
MTVGRVPCMLRKIASCKLMPKWHSAGMFSGYNPVGTFIDGGTMASPTVFARRSLSYLLSEMPQEARSDAVQAQVISPGWHIASYLQAAALFALGVEHEAQVALREGSALEAKKSATAAQ